MSWSLIADICINSDEVGFLPDFIALKFKLHPVTWQPDIYPYRILAIHKAQDKQMQKRLKSLLEKLKKAFFVN